jgi:acetyl-CoA carboxylase carboxyltransferase component
MIGDPSVMGGALTRAAAQKMERFVDLCDSFHLPIIHLVDQPGVMIGPDAERAGTLLAAAKAAAAIEQATVPWVSIVLRRAYGVATVPWVSIVLRRAYGVAGSMLGPWSGPSGTSLNHRFAWPTARWGSIPIEGGVAAAHKREIAASDNPDARRAELERQYEALASPYRTAEAFGVVDVIAPSETRPLLCDWIGDAVRLTRQSPAPRRRTLR